MKINIITCHDVYNYGASLQAFALMRYLMSIGHDVEIIDYKPDYLSHHYEFGYVNESNRFYPLCQKSKLFKFLYGIRLLPITYGTWQRIRPFNDFKKTYLRCTGLYKSFDELKNNPPIADVYIAGSDQIWNCNLPNGKDPAFYLAFGQPARKISYAASFAMNGMPDMYKDLVSSYLRNLDAISVRETSGIRILDELGYTGTAVIDPVYLLDKENWLHITESPKPYQGEYILVYNLNRKNIEMIRKEAQRLSSLYKLKIVSIDSSFKCSYSDKNIHDAGPLEFVSLIANAKYVVTDSFHGMSFSIIMERPFCVMHSHSDSSRIKDLLSELSLESCLNNPIQDFTNLWPKAKIRILDKSSSGKRFLIDNLSIEKND